MVLPDCHDSNSPDYEDALQCPCQRWRRTRWRRQQLRHQRASCRHDQRRDREALRTWSRALQVQQLTLVVSLETVALVGLLVSMLAWVLVAIATPATYVQQPLRVFELDFEANLPIVRSCVKYKKRILFPSTSEVYGMCRDSEFDPDHSELVLGPIEKQRWIYSCSKQLMDRVIWGYGMQEGLDFTLFRPFNWIGAGLDSIHTPKEGSSRVITQFFGHIVRGENIKLVDGGTQKRAFTYIDDGVSALMKMIDNKDGIATGKIYNVGNPVNNFSVKELADMMLKLAMDYPEYRDTAAKVKLIETSSEAYYGKGYQDVQNRVPKITNTMKELDWAPKVNMADALRFIFDSYRGQVAEARGLVD